MREKGGLPPIYNAKERFIDFLDYLLIVFYPLVLSAFFYFDVLHHDPKDSD